MGEEVSAHARTIKRRHRYNEREEMMLFEMMERRDAARYRRREKRGIPHPFVVQWHDYAITWAVTLDAHENVVSVDARAPARWRMEGKS